MFRNCQVWNAFDLVKNVFFTEDSSFIIHLNYVQVLFFYKSDQLYIKNNHFEYFLLLENGLKLKSEVCFIDFSIW